LKKINSAAKKIASGKFDERLDISSEDEIGELARSFNNMAGELQNLETCEEVLSPMCPMSLEPR